VLAVLAAGLSFYLTLYQWDVIDSVWDPVFGSASSQAVLKSSFSEALPIPDATLGAIAYVAEAALALVGSRERWRAETWLVLVYGALVAAMVLTSAALICIQAFVVGHFCALCLVSAGVSFVNAALAWDEVEAALGEVKRSKEEAYG
jgi:uncharacterized membrane protein